MLKNWRAVRFKNMIKKVYLYSLNTHALDGSPRSCSLIQGCQIARNPLRSHRYFLFHNNRYFSYSRTQIHSWPYKICFQSDRLLAHVEGRSSFQISEEFLPLVLHDQHIIVLSLNPIPNFCASCKLNKPNYARL